MGQSNITDYHPSGFANYSDGSDCPVVTIDPGLLFDAVHSRLQEYTSELNDQDGQFDEARRKFKVKFESSYGVTISIAV